MPHGSHLGMGTAGMGTPATGTTATRLGHHQDGSGALRGPHPRPAVWGLAGSQLSPCSWLPAAVEHAEQPPEPFFLPALS